jgi:hypothetical protein
MTRQLSRLRAERAREALSRAGGQMEEAGQSLERGQDPEDPQDEALDRLDEARRDLQQAREDAEEELAREKLGKVADQLRRMKERQEALNVESARIHREVLEKKAWGRGLLLSLGELARAQDGLAQEIDSLAEGKLKAARVFARVLGKSAEAMKQAAESMRDRFQKAKDNADPELDVPAEEAADKQTQRLQQLALQRLEQLLEALKPEAGVPQRSRRQGGPMGERPKAGGDGIPQLAQLKALKALQEEVNRRTEAFARAHPEGTKLTKQEQKELAAIRADQDDIARLFNELTAAEGDKP